MSGPHTEDPTYLPVRAALDWTPPPDMIGTVILEWKAFYRSIQAKYGLSPKDYRDLYVAQHGCCYICRKAKGKHPDDPKGRGGRRLGVDHNHLLGPRKGAVRGLLCSGGPNTCNRIIGWLNVAQLGRAIQYLEAPPAQMVWLAQAAMSGDTDWPENQGAADQYLSGILGLK